MTHYDLIEAYRSASLLDIKLETGRTHQIRVHMSAHRHPCVGDLTYGADPDPGQAPRADPAVAARGAPGLRAPDDGSWVEFSSTYPADLQRALDTISAESQ
ncbi:Pseudouridine synthase OS=Streptomyces microflavus OX=1919 GN=Smic_18100 PE=3 SV=1 [Streptomyces microflavus]